MAVSAAGAASRRRVLYGFNAALQALLAAAVVCGLVWLASQVRWQADLTRSGINSLSPMTRQLLGRLDQDILITAISAEPDKRDELGQKRRRELTQLLELYDSAGGARVTTRIVDPTQQETETKKVLAELQALPAYQDEARPHAAALAKFPPLNQRIVELAENEAREIERLVGTDPRLAQNRSLAIVVRNLRGLSTESAALREQLEQLTTNGEIPRYGQAIEKVRTFLLSTVQAILQDARAWMTGDAQNLAGLSPELKEFFAQAGTRYDPLLAEVTALLDATKDLKAVKLEDIHRDLTRWQSGPPLLVTNGKEARVVGFDEIWRFPTDPNAPVGPDGDNREFNGEAALTAAILQLTQTERTAIIFTRFGGESPIKPDFSRMQMTMQMPHAPFEQLNQQLLKANFLTEDWDVKTAKQPPEVAGAARKIFVVFPPTPPPRANPLEPPAAGGMTPQDRQIVLDAVDAAGMAIFLAGFQPPTSPLPGMDPPYEYAEYLRKTWGVDVKYTNLALEFTPHPQKPGWWVPASRDPRLITTDRAVRLTEHVIGRALQSDRAGFYMAAPLLLIGGEERPAGVQTEIVMEARPSEDVWAPDDLRRLNEEWQRNQALQPGPNDLKAPFPLAVAAVRDGKKLVVFGSEEFMADAIASAAALQEVGNTLVLAPLYPANTDLFINAVNWLTGEADRIAPGPRRAMLPRLTELTPQTAARLPWFLVGIWPALALLAGLVIGFVRRR